MGWTQDEIGKVIGVSQSGVGERFVSEFPDLENQIQTLLADGHPHTDVWTLEEIGHVLRMSKSNVSEKLCSAFPGLENTNKKLLDDGHPHTDIANRLNLSPILVWHMALGWTQGEISAALKRQFPDATGTKQASVSESLSENGHFRMSIKTEAPKGHLPETIAKRFALPEIVTWALVLDGLAAQHTPDVVDHLHSMNASEDQGSIRGRGEPRSWLLGAPRGGCLAGSGRKYPPGTPLLRRARSRCHRM